MLFDAVNAYVAYRIAEYVPALARNKGARFLSATALFLLPSVLMNGALWGQSDAIYASGILFSLWALLAEAPFWAAIAFGLALSVKLQAIFFAPVLIGYLIRQKRTAWYVFVAPVVFFISVVPAALSGGNLWYWLFIYSKEMGEYQYLSVSAQSIFAFAQPLGLSAQITSVLFWIGIIVSAALALIILALVARVRAFTLRTLMTLSLASVLLLPYFLPRMHERYFYLADLISVVYAFFAPRRAFVPVCVVLASTLAYFPYLSSQVSYFSGLHFDLRIPATLLLVPVSVVLFDLYQLVRAERAETGALWRPLTTSLKRLVL